MWYNVVMHLVVNKVKHGKKIYNSVLLRESYREGGKVKKRTIANLSHCSKEEIEAIRLALKCKGNLSQLIDIDKDIRLEQGLSVGAVWALYRCAERMGIVEALGRGTEGKLALWQVMARVIEQGSRLSAVRLAEEHAALEVLNLKRGFDENDLYENLRWVARSQGKIEERLLKARGKEGKIKLFLYDVTSSYLEGQKNYFAEYGYNRDGKKGKKQIVIGMLCDEEGVPVSVEVFKGNTADMKTFYAQVKKVAERFGCKEVTFVGDRGMIKREQIERLPEGFHYITAITKAEIRALVQKGTIQMELFDEQLCEVIEGTERYILRRNPIRQKEAQELRQEKINSLKCEIEKQNGYLRGHERAKVEVAKKKVERMIEKLKIGKWATVEARGRVLELVINEERLKEEQMLDGCYVIKTDLSKEVADKEVVHDRYKELALVEQVFRTAKSTLGVRPVFVRTEESTRGHVFIVMLAYILVRYLQRAWEALDITVQEGVALLSQICSVKVTVNKRGQCYKVVSPTGKAKALLEAISVKLPEVLPPRKHRVVTRKKVSR
jgi:transposase